MWATTDPPDLPPREPLTWRDRLALAAIGGALIAFWIWIGSHWIAP